MSQATYTKAVSDYMADPTIDTFDKAFGAVVIGDFERYGSIRNRDQAERRNIMGGGFWFSRGAMRFFHSRIGRRFYPDFKNARSLFVTSEQFDWRHPRLYSIRAIDWEDGDVSTVGEFQAYETGRQAVAEIRRMLRA